MSWQFQAVCVGDLRMTTRDSEIAATVIEERCAVCPVIAECREWANVERDYEGVAGGQWWIDRQPKPLPKRVPVPTDDEVRAGHAAFARGHRDEETRKFEAAYQRARHQRRKEALSA